jgi:hypothetical protein
MILNDLYDAPAKGFPQQSKLILTNFPFKAAYTRGTLKEDEYGTLKHTETFLKVNVNLGSKALMSRLHILELTTVDTLQKILSEESDEYRDDDTIEIARIFS